MNDHDIFCIESGISGKIKISNNDHHTATAMGINKNLSSASKYLLRKFNGVIWWELNGETAALISGLQSRDVSTSPCIHSTMTINTQSTIAGSITTLLIMLQAW